nr:hypothetical protein [Epibacterium ulvae]
MIENTRTGGISDKPQKSHMPTNKDFAKLLPHSPNTTTPEELRAYQLHMTDSDVTSSTFNMQFVALRFFSTYPPRCDLEQPPNQHRCRYHGLPLEGLSDHTGRPDEDPVDWSRLSFPPPPLPDGCHSIRHSYLLASVQCRANITSVRVLIEVSTPEHEPTFEAQPAP